MYSFDLFAVQHSYLHDLLLSFHFAFQCILYIFEKIAIVGIHELMGSISVSFVLKLTIVFATDFNPLFIEYT